MRLQTNKHVFLTAGLFAIVLATTSCRSHYALKGIERTVIVVDSRYDAQPDERAVAFLAPYKQQVDSIMGPVVGEVAHDMSARRPESDLSNLLADILVWASKDYGEQPVLGLYNMGGIRAALSKGKVTRGDVLDVAPFENRICFLTLTGAKLLELFTQIASVGGEGVSHGVELVITPQRQLVSARLHGKEIDPESSYRVVTINYLLEGNDKMMALRSGTDVVAPEESSNNTRFIIMNYFQDKTARGEVVRSQVEGRITIKQ